MNNTLLRLITALFLCAALLTVTYLTGGFIISHYQWFIVIFIFIFLALVAMRLNIHLLTILQIIAGLAIAIDIYYRGYFNLYWGMPVLIWILQGIKNDLKRENRVSFTGMLKNQFYAKGFFNFIASIIRLGWCSLWLISVIFNII